MVTIIIGKEPGLTQEDRDCHCAICIALWVNISDKGNSLDEISCLRRTASGRSIQGHTFYRLLEVRHLITLLYFVLSQGLMSYYVAQPGLEFTISKLT